MSQSSIKNVLVVGASGNVGRSTIKALLDESFSVTGLTRESSKATLPANVRQVKTDYSAASLLAAFKGQDAVVSTVSGIAPGEGLSLQTAIIEAAIEAGVKVFVPSEFGIDTSDPPPPPPPPAGIYFQKFSRATVDSEAFKAALYEFFAEDAAAVAALNSVDWHNWYHKPGLPPKPDFHSPKYDDCVGLAAKWRRLTSSSDFQPCAADVENWTAGQLLVFLDSLLEAPEPITVEPSRLLGSLYCLRQSKNFEVLSRYLRIGLRAKDVSLLDNVEEFLGQTGRMKFVRPLFESLQSVDHEFARKVFAKYENFYHPTCLRLLRRVLSIQ